MDSCPSVALETIMTCVWMEAQKKVKVMQMLTSISSVKPKNLNKKTRFAELETFRLDLVTLKV